MLKRINKDLHGRWRPWVLTVVMAILFVMLPFGLSGAAGQESEPLEVGVKEEAFWQLVDETRSSMMGGGVTDEVRDLFLSRWTEIEFVELTDGRRVSLSTETVVQLLEADPFEAEAVEAYMTALLETRSRWPDSPFADPAVLEDAQQTLEAVLADERYSDLGQSTPWEAWLEWLRSLFPEAEEVSQSPAGGATGGLVRILTIAAAGIILFVIVILLLRATAGLASETALEDGFAAAEEPLTAKQALNRADTVAGDGDYRTAVRYLYLSTLLSLDEKNVIRFDRSLTNREVVRAVADQPALAAILRDVVEIFDRVWYGFWPIDRQTFERYRQQVVELEKQERRA